MPTHSPASTSKSPSVYQGMLRGLLLLSLLPGLATGLDLGDVQVHGFLSQAAIKTSENRFFGDSDQGSFGLTEVGVNASYRPHPSLLLSGQVLARRAGDMSDGTPSLDYLLTDLSMISTPRTRLGVRVGRIKSPLGLYNETRDVPFTRPGIFLPQVIYYEKVRNLVLSSDGAMLDFEKFGDWGTLSLVAGGGRPLIDDNVEWSFTGQDADGSFRSNDLFWSGRLLYQDPAEKLTLAWSFATNSMMFDQGPRSLLGEGKINYFYWIASARYDTERWTLDAEYMREPISWRDFGPFLADQKLTTEGWYLQLTWRLRSSLQWMLRFEEGFADRNDPHAENSVAVALGLFPAYVNHTRAWTTGMRWDITNSLMLRLEYQHHHGTFILSPRETAFDAGETPWDMVAAQLSWRF